MSNGTLKSEIYDNVNTICACFDKLDANIQRINSKVNEITEIYFKYSYSMSNDINETNSYLKFQIELLKNERAYCENVKQNLKEKFVKDIHGIAEMLVMLMGSLESIYIDNKADKDNILKRVTSIKKMNTNQETSEIIELFNATLHNLDLLHEFIQVFDKYIVETIEKYKRDNIHCNNFKVTLKSKKHSIALEHQKFINKIQELVEYFLKCTKELNLQLENQKLLDFLVSKKQ